MSGGAIAAEVAQAEFERFAAAMKLDLEDLDSEDKKNLETEKGRFLRAIQKGRMIVDDAGQPVFSPESGDPITFHRPRGATLMAIDKRKAGEEVTKGLAMLAEMTRQPIVRYHDMPLTDLRVCQAVAALFLG